MTDERDPQFENEILAAIRAPLVRAIDDADTRSSARTGRYRLLAAACVGVLIVGGAVAVWRTSRGGDGGRTVRVAPTTTVPTATTLPVEPAKTCAGTDLDLAGSGAVARKGSPFYYLDLRNRSSKPCFVPYPTLATALNAANQRVGLAGIDHIAGDGPLVAPGATTRLELATANPCVPSGHAPRVRFSGLVVTVAGWPFAAPDLDVALCTQGIGAVTFGAAPPAHTESVAPVDPTAVNIGPGTHVIHLERPPARVGSGIGNGLTESIDRRLVAYEFDSPVVHEIALLDTTTCKTKGCAEQVLGRGHSPVLGPDGALAYVALDDVPLGPDDIAIWKRPGSVTVRAADGAAHVWAHGRGYQTIAWAGDTLLVEHDVDSADTEGFEELMLYRGPNDRTVLSGGLIAISPDGTRLLLGGAGTDQMLQLYDVTRRQVVSSISIADYEHAIASAGDLKGVDLSQWPGFENDSGWPVSCCANFDGATLWHGDTVLFPMTIRRTRQPTRRIDGVPIFRKPAPTVVPIVGDRILPPRTLRVHGVMDDYDAGTWLPGSSTEFALARNDLTPPVLVRCRIEGNDARCTADPSVATAFRQPTITPNTNLP